MTYINDSFRSMIEAEIREKIAQEIESRICDVVHNETAPEACEKMNDGLRVAAYIARCIND